MQRELVIIWGNVPHLSVGMTPQLPYSTVVGAHYPPHFDAGFIYMCYVNKIGHRKIVEPRFNFLAFQNFLYLHQRRLFETHALLGGRHWLEGRPPVSLLV